MRSLFLAFALLISAPALAKTVTVECQGKAYGCGPAGCIWQNTVRFQPVTLRMVQDKAYPNPGYPHEVWRARYLAAYDGHDLVLNLVFSPHEPDAAVMVYGNLAAANVMAEASSEGRIDIALRNQNYGRGFFCSRVFLNHN